MSRLEQFLGVQVEAGAPAAAGGLREVVDILIHPWISAKELFLADISISRTGMAVSASPVQTLTKVRSALAIAFVHFGVPLYLIYAGMTGSVSEVASAASNSAALAFVTRPALTALLGVGGIYVVTLILAGVTSADRRKVVWRHFSPNRSVARRMAYRISIALVLPAISICGPGVLLIGPNADPKTLGAGQKVLAVLVVCFALWYLVWGSVFLLSHVYYAVESSFRAYETWPYLAPAMIIWWAVVGIFEDDGNGYFLRADVDATQFDRLSLFSTIGGAVTLLLLAMVETVYVWRRRHGTS